MSALVVGGAGLSAQSPIPGRSPIPSEPPIGIPLEDLQPTTSDVAPVLQLELPAPPSSGVAGLGGVLDVVA